MMKFDLVEVYGKENCQYCTAAKNLLQLSGIEYKYYELNTDFTRDEILDRFPDAKTFPQIVITMSTLADPVVYDIGGYTQLRDIISTMELEELLTKNIVKINFLKENGDNRAMLCTLKQDLLPEFPEDTRKKVRNPFIIPVFDLDLQEWRSFRYTSLIDYELV